MRTCTNIQDKSYHQTGGMCQKMEDFGLESTTFQDASSMCPSQQLMSRSTSFNQNEQQMFAEDIQTLSTSGSEMSGEHPTLTGNFTMFGLAQRPSSSRPTSCLTTRMSTALAHHIKEMDLIQMKKYILEEHLMLENLNKNHRVLKPQPQQQLQVLRTIPTTPEPMDLNLSLKNNNNNLKIYLHLNRQCHQ